MAVGRCSGGEGRLVGDLAAGDANGAGERKPVGVVACFVGRLAHQFPDSVVRQEQSVDLLFDHVGRLAAQDLAATAQVGLDLVQRRFVLPPLGIGGGQLGGADPGGVQDSGDQADQFPVGMGRAR